MPPISPDSLKQNAYLSNFKGLPDKTIDSMQPFEAMLRMAWPARNPAETNDFIFITETNHKESAHAIIDMQALLAMRASNPNKKMAFFYELPPEENKILTQNIEEFCKEHNILYFQVDDVASRNKLDKLDKKGTKIRADIAYIGLDKQSEFVDNKYAELKKIRLEENALHTRRNEVMVENIARLTKEHGIEKAIIMNGDWHLSNPESNSSKHDMDELLQNALPDKNIAYVRINVGQEKPVQFLGSPTDSKDKDKPDMELAPLIGKPIQKIADKFESLDLSDMYDQLSTTAAKRYEHPVSTPLWDLKTAVLHCSALNDGFIEYPSQKMRVQINDTIQKTQAVLSQENPGELKDTLVKLHNGLTEIKGLYQQKAKEDIELMEKRLPKGFAPPYAIKYLKEIAKFEDFTPSTPERVGFGMADNKQPHVQDPVQEARREAQRIIEEAQKEATRIKAEATKEAERIKSGAKENKTSSVASAINSYIAQSGLSESAILSDPKLTVPSLPAPHNSKGIV